MSARAAFLTIGLLTPVLLPAAPACAADPALRFGPSTRVAPDDAGERSRASVARGEDGSLLLTARRTGVFRAVRRAAGGRFETPRVVPGAERAYLGIYDPVLGADGSSLILWQPTKASGKGGAPLLRAAVAGAKGRYRTRTSPDLGSSPEVVESAISASGRLDVLLAKSGGLRLLTGGSRGSLELQEIAPVSESVGASEAFLRTGASGAGIVAWSGQQPCLGDPARTCAAVRAALRARGASRFSAPVTIDESLPRPGSGPRSGSGVISKLRLAQVASRIVLSWRRADATDDGLDTLRIASGSFTGFGAPVSVPGTGRVPYTIPSGESGCGANGGPGLTRSVGARGVALLAGAEGGLELLLTGQDSACTAASSRVRIEPGGPSQPPRPDPVRTHYALVPGVVPGPGGRTLIYGQEQFTPGGQLGVERIDTPGGPARAVLALGNASVVASGWDGDRALLAVKVPCGTERVRLDAYAIASTGSARRVRVTTCSPEPPVAFDGRGRLVLFLRGPGERGIDAVLSCPVADVAQRRGRCRPGRP